MSTIGASRKASKQKKSCGNCVVPISWVDICTKCHSFVYKPIYTFWPPAPAYLTEYDSFEQASYYTIPSNWDKEMTQSCGAGITTCTSSISYDCVSAAGGGTQVGSPKIEYTEEWLRREDFTVQFRWYGARRNPLYPGTYGAPPYIRELIPADKLPNGGNFDRPRNVYEKTEIKTTQYKGRIDCQCGEPSQCGC